MRSLTSRLQRSVYRRSCKLLSLPSHGGHRWPQPGVVLLCTCLQGSPDWDRVVAVIVQGAKWQFKDWPFKVAADVLSAKAHA
jgi:hypothetical protein